MKIHSEISKQSFKNMDIKIEDNMIMEIMKVMDHPLETYHQRGLIIHHTDKVLTHLIDIKFQDEQYIQNILARYEHKIRLI